MSIAQFTLSYELCPIILTGGIAGVGGQLPITNILQSDNYPDGITGQGDDIDLQDYLAHFTPLPGAALLNLKMGEYTFSNQQTAANAVIFDPTRFSLMMVAPAPGDGGYTDKLTTYMSLVTTLKQHALMGGLYTVCTPAFVWDNSILLNVHDISANDTVQVQTRWQFDFIQPLVTAADAQPAQNSWMQKSAGGQQQTPGPNGSIPWSSPQNAVGGNPGSGTAAPLLPSGTPLGGVAAGNSGTGS